MSAGRHLLIVGASGRAAAASARRAGWQPVVIDLFGDTDTRALGPVMPCALADYPHGFVALAAQAPPGPWMYTGGLENHPDVVEAIARTRPLFGIAPDVLKRVRDPFYLQPLMPMPAMQRGSEGLDPAKRWLRKPLRGSGGLGIARIIAAAPASGSDEFYSQEWLDAPSRSALFLFNEGIAPSPIGVCTQLVGEPWLHAPPFQYCGNIGPLPMDDGMEDQLRRIGKALRALGLRGLVGIDFLRVGDGVVVLEVNPRYTASVELYERASGRSLLSAHIAAFADETGALPQAEESQPLGPAIHGKAILYAERALVVPARHPWHGPAFADIPPAGSAISAGQPVVTLFASGDTETECRERLMALARASAPR